MIKKLQKINKEQVASFKDALTKNKSGSGGGNPNFLKLVTPKEKKKDLQNIYKVRLLPTLAEYKSGAIDTENVPALFHYKSHGWQSVKTGKFVSDEICPTTFGDSSPIVIYTINQYKKLKEQGITDKKDKRRTKLLPLATKENWLVNVFVVNDPVNPENNGKVMVLKIGKKIFDIITKALADEELYGERIFDLSEDGCNFRISVGWNSDGPDAYPSYDGSLFEQKGTPIPGIKTEKDIDNLYKNYHNLQEQFKVKSYEDLNKLLKEHWIGESESSEESDNDSDNEPDVDEEDEIPDLAPPASAKKTAAKKTAQKKTQQTETVSADLDELDELINNS